MRIIKTNNLGNLLGELDPATVYALTSVDEINGENSLIITTSETIDKQTRLLFMDAWGNWREYVVLGVEEQHQDADFAFNTYYAVWSMQYELSGTILKSQPGKNSPVNATAALTAALTGTRWSVGTVEPTTLAGASFYYLNAWEALGEIIKNWGGEVSEKLTVGDTGITSRAVDLLDRMGSDGVAGRFEFGRDVTEITRTEEDRPYYCRVIPRGQAIESDAGGYSRKVGIASVNPTGKEYLEDPETVSLVRIPIGGGRFIYPTTVVEYEEITDPQELYNRALADLHNHTRPVVSYTATVLEFENAGLTDRLQLGDTVQVVDRTFNKDGLRIEGRITRFEVDHLEHKNSRPVIGFNPSGFSGQFEAMQSSIDGLGQWRDLLQGALSADEYGNLVATADLDVNGAITGESFNLWHGQRNLSSADNIDQLYESGIYYLPGSVPGGTYPSGANGQYASLLSMGNTAEGSSTGWVGRQILVQGASGVWHRTYAGSPRAWTDWRPLDESSHPTEIPASSLTLRGCSLNGPSTVPAYKIGRHVTINMRVNVTAANPTIAGFPATSGANSHIPVIAYRQSDNAAIAGYLTNAGVVTFPALASGSNIMLHVEYVASS